jgi:hypothetical protein
VAKTRLIVFGLEPGPFFDDQPEIDSFVDPPPRDSVDELLDALAEATAEGGCALVIHPWWFPPESLDTLDAARSLLNVPRVGIYRTALPPLAGAVLASIAASVARQVPSAGSLFALLPQLEPELHVFAWLGNLAGLSDPAPSLLQRASSLLPGSAFGVSSWPKPSVRRLSRGDESVPVPESDQPLGLAVAPAEGDAEWVGRALEPALGGPPVVEVEATPHGPAWWGTGQLVEAVAYPLKPTPVAKRLLKGLELRKCQWCGETIASAPCPLCGAAGERQPTGEPQPAG